MSIEEELFPNNGELKTENGVATAQIVDAELDPIECEFNYDQCVQINTSGLEYITLSIENLEELQDLIVLAEVFYKNQESPI